MKKETTTITVWRETVEELKKLKAHPRQPIAEVVDILTKGART